MNESEKDPALSEASEDIEAELQTAEENEASEKAQNEEQDATEDNSETYAETNGTDYAELARADMRELIELFPHLRGKESVAELDNPLRYAALRDLGLTPKEAYLATNAYTAKYDNRSHLMSAVPKPASASEDMLDARGLEAARELFAGLSDREIQRLYKKVSK